MQTATFLAEESFVLWNSSAPYTYHFNINFWCNYFKHALFIFIISKWISDETILSTHYSYNFQINFQRKYFMGNRQSISIILFPSSSLFSGLSKQGIWCKTLVHFQRRQRDKTLYWIGKKMQLVMFSFSACLRNQQLSHGKWITWGGHFLRNGMLRTERFKCQTG